MIRKSKKKGFTLVELVIVIAVIAILAGVMIATFSNVVEKANASKAFQEMKSRVDSAYIECLTEEKDVQYIAVDGNGAGVLYFFLGGDGHCLHLLFSCCRRRVLLPWK